MIRVSGTAEPTPMIRHPMPTHEAAWDAAEAASAAGPQRFRICSTGPDAMNAGWRGSRLVCHSCRLVGGAAGELLEPNCMAVCVPSKAAPPGVAVFTAYKSRRISKGALRQLAPAIAGGVPR